MCTDRKKKNSQPEGKERNFVRRENHADKGKNCTHLILDATAHL